jgi:hypothetical protein
VCAFAAAELLRYGRMGMPADVYAFGITMWELYTGQVRARHNDAASSIIDNLEADQSWFKLCI